MSTDTLRLVGYCGLYCGLCAERARIPRDAIQLRKTLREADWDEWTQYVPNLKETYPKFVEFLEMLMEMDCSCRTGKGGPSDCEMRICAKERKIDLCPMCEDFPCPHIVSLAEVYPTIIQDGKRMKKVGIRKWTKEQEERARRGFVYADIRHRK